MAQFLDEKEKRIFCKEWEKTRREVLAKLDGRTIILTGTATGEEYKKQYGFINTSRSTTSN